METTNNEIEILDHNSSTISKTKYSYTEKELAVTFLTGTTYIYNNVDENVYREFKDSESKGNFFTKNIRSNYTFNKLEANEK